MKTQPLTATEQARIDDAIGAFIQMADDAGLLGDEPELDTPELADELLIRWAAEPPKARLPDDLIATIVGAAIGDYLCEALRLRWAVNSPDRAVGLAVEDTGEPLFSPFNLVRDRLPHAAEGVVPDLLEEIADQTKDLHRMSRRI
ncbi:MAG: hypothetical protein K2Q09_01375 [Phycisphaerales bacterium]|nr:hypothetical protein [Phycisphaerales bacterium]